MGLLIVAILGFLFYLTTCIVSAFFFKEDESSSVEFVIFFLLFLVMTIIFGFGVIDCIRNKTWTPEYKIEEMEKEIAAKEKRIEELKLQIKIINKDGFKPW